MKQIIDAFPFFAVAISPYRSEFFLRLPSFMRSRYQTMSRNFFTSIQENLIMIQMSISQFRTAQQVTSYQFISFLDDVQPFLLQFKKFSSSHYSYAQYLSIFVRSHIENDTSHSKKSFFHFYWVFYLTRIFIPFKSLSLLWWCYCFVFFDTQTCCMSCAIFLSGNEHMFYVSCFYAIKTQKWISFCALTIIIMCNLNNKILKSHMHGFILRDYSISLNLTIRYCFSSTFD